MHASCCSGVWCHNYDELEQRHSDHLCRLTRMRLGIIPAAEWVPASSYPLEPIRALGAARSNQSRAVGGARRASRFPEYLVPTRRLDTLWRAAPLLGRRLDF